MLGKSQIWVGKLNFGNSSPKNIKFVLIYTVFLDFSILLQIFCPSLKFHDAIENCFGVIAKITSANLSKPVRS